MSHPSYAKGYRFERAVQDALSDFSGREWRAIPGVPFHFISEDGAVVRFANLKGCPDTRGYRILNIMQDGERFVQPIHRLVALAFHGPQPSPKHLVAHSDGNNKNNHYTNLRWATQQENGADVTKHGVLRGSRHPQSKLTEKAAREIREKYAALPGGVKWKRGVTKLGREYGVGRNTVRLIAKGTKWGHA